MMGASDAAAPVGAPPAGARDPPSSRRRGRGAPAGGVAARTPGAPLPVGSGAGAAHRPVAGASGAPAAVPFGPRDTAWSPVAQ